MENVPASINLIKKKETAYFDKFIDWTLGIGRLIVITTEIIAIAAFLYRFSLDEKLVRLHGDIREKQSQLSLLKNDEENFRNLQSRLKLASNFSEEGAKVYKIFQDIIGFTPQEIKFNDLTLKKDRADIDINSTSISSLTGFVNSLKTYSNVKSVSVDNIDNRPGIGLTVTITALFK